MIAVIGVNIMLGTTVSRILRQNHAATSLSGQDIQSFLRKLQRFTVTTSTVLIIGIISLVIYAIIQASQHKWSWLILNTIFRAVELVLIILFYPLVRKDKPVGGLQDNELRTTSGSQLTPE